MPEVPKDVGLAVYKVVAMMATSGTRWSDCRNCAQGWPLAAQSWRPGRPLVFHEKGNEN